MRMTHTPAANWHINNPAWFSWRGTGSHLRNLLSASTFCLAIFTVWHNRRRFCTCSPSKLLMAYWYRTDVCSLLILLIIHSLLSRSLKFKHWSMCIWNYNRISFLYLQKWYGMVWIQRIGLVIFYTFVSVFKQFQNSLSVELISSVDAKWLAKNVI